ncbi:hypothetical protein GHT06_010044 [Daphnia sinensis]|uniref:Uncharacterized protein n=1 Tax=Daphnia sinensis TaxID=1820382 RepID=A0AAD5Q0R4_9CRUS|nr:hypothetical protein GHT06_010044 [Daphnia sinensis]
MLEQWKQSNSIVDHPLHAPFCQNVFAATDLWLIKLREVGNATGAAESSGYPHPTFNSNLTQTNLYLAECRSRMPHNSRDYTIIFMLTPQGHIHEYHGIG